MKSVLSLYRYTAAELAALLGGALHGDGGAVVENIVTDSREVEANSLFAAIPGERVDGHDFIPTAAEAGASCVLASRLPECIPSGCAIVLVDDVVAALGTIAHDYAAKTPGRTVAVTGSVGKTTTKEFLSAVLGQRFRLHKTSGNHNNEIGLPMTMLDAPKDVEMKVYEMGMCDLGEIDYLSRIAEPDIAIITTIGSSHLETLGTRENICRAKLEITHGLKPDGIFLCNGDEPLLYHETLEGRRPLFVALRNRHADFRAVNIRSGIGKTTFDLLCRDSAVTNIEIPVIGVHHVYAALFAYAVGMLCGMEEQEIRRGLLLFKNTGMRQHIYDLQGVTVIEDCYNASPESMRAASDVLFAMAEQRGARTVALLGDMRELGPDSAFMHHQLGTCVAKRGLDYLFTLGGSAEEIALGAIHAGMRADRVFANPDCARPEHSGEMLLQILRPGDVLLVKASRAVAAERVIAYLKENAERIGEAK